MPNLFARFLLICALALPSLVFANSLSSQQYQQFLDDYPDYRASEVEMGKAYRAVSGQLDSTEAEALKRQQVEWLEERAALVENFADSPEDEIVVKLKKMSELRTEQLLNFGKTVTSAGPMMKAEREAERKIQEEKVSQDRQEAQLAVTKKDSELRAEAERGEAAALRAKNQAEDEKIKQKIEWCAYLVYSLLAYWAFRKAKRAMRARRERLIREAIRLEMAAAASRLGTEIASSANNELAVIAHRKALALEMEQRKSAESTLAQLLGK